jgi:zinc protease
VIYGDFPLGRPAVGTEASVNTIEPKHCREFHQRIYVPNNTTLAVVGDFDSQAVIAEITELTKDWKNRELPELKLPPIKSLAKSTEEIIPMEGKAQLNVYMGHLGVTRDNPDYYKLLVMDNILGVGTGFTDRLSSRLRDQQGLAYTVTASITSTAGEEPGVFSAFVGCEARDFAEVKTIVKEVIEGMRDKKPENWEVEETKSYLVGAMPFKLATNEDLAEQLLLIEKYHLGLDYQKKFREAIKAVTVDDVSAVARTYLHPDRMATVAAGPIQAPGSQQPKPDKPEQ